MNVTTTTSSSMFKEIHIIYKPRPKKFVNNEKTKYYCSNCVFNPTPPPHSLVEYFISSGINVFQYCNAKFCGCPIFNLVNLCPCFFLYELITWHTFLAMFDMHFFLSGQYIFNIMNLCTNTLE